MPLKVWFTTNAQADDIIEQYCREIVAICETDLKERVDPRRFLPATTAAEADLIVFIESPRHKMWDYADTLLQNELIRKYPNKCFAFSWEDNPPEFLPGIYMSILRSRMNPARFRSGFPFRLNNALLNTVSDVEPRLLASFRGSASSEIRKKLFASVPSTDEIVISQVFKWFNHDEQDLSNYANELWNSKFGLCPRGIGPSTFRLFEIMAAGRIPVILADEWVPTSGPAWNECALIVAEDRMKELPEILHRYEPCWRDMGKAARAAYETWFSPEVIVYRILQNIEEIYLSRPEDHNEADYQSQWKSWRFGWQNNWTLPQKLDEIYRSGKLTERIRSKITRQSGNGSSSST